MHNVAKLTYLLTGHLFKLINQPTNYSYEISQSNDLIKKPSIWKLLCENVKQTNTNITKNETIEKTVCFMEKVNERLETVSSQ